MRPYRAVVLTAALLVAVAGCAGVPSGASSSVGTSPAGGPTASTAPATPRPTPKPSRVTPGASRAKPSATGRPTATPVPQATAGGTIYIVKAGDTLNVIAARFKVPVKAILAANPGITNPNQIAIGQKIVIPKP